jgi:hypothetical protein
MAGTQGIKGDTGDTGRVLFYLGSFKDGTLKEEPVIGLLNKDRCDYYIDANDQAWMRTGTKEEEYGYKNEAGGPQNNTNYWTKSKKVGFLQAGAISADMINVDTLVADEAFINAIKTTEISADKINTTAFWRFTIKEREKPMDYVFYPTEQISIGMIMEELKKT